MKLESLEDKSSSAHIAIKADNLIRRMYQHILNHKCEHCKQVLSNIEAGNQPAPNPEPVSTPTYSNTTQNRMSISTP